MKDEHPVKMVSDFLYQGGVMEPLKTWLVSRLPGALLPAASKMFDPHQHLGFHEPLIDYATPRA